MEKSYISSFAGTTRFVAPELWPAEGGSYLAYGTPADVYSLGIVHGMLVVAKAKQLFHSQGNILIVILLLGSNNFLIVNYIEIKCK